MNVRLLNINDNEPEFEDTEYTFTVAEDLSVGDIIGKVSATDQDHDVLLYTILNQGNILSRYLSCTDTVRTIYFVLMQ